MKKCENINCSSPAEAERYDYCYECWWAQDPRNIENGGTVDLREKKDYEGPQRPEVDFPPVSLNNRFIVESYKEDRGLKTQVKNGFAMVQQKVSLQGLKLLANVTMTDGSKYGQSFQKGDIAYIKEGALQSQPWAKATFTSEAIEGEFMIVDMAHIEFVVRK